jgi:hypothetical protein
VQSDSLYCAVSKRHACFGSNLHMDVGCC